VGALALALASEHEHVVVSWAQIAEVLHNVSRVPACHDALIDDGVMDLVARLRVYGTDPTSRLLTAMLIVNLAHSGGRIQEVCCGRL